MTATLKLVKLESVKPHPDNPRVVMREDVVGAIVANLGDEYPKKHAVHVRPAVSLVPGPLLEVDRAGKRRQQHKLGKRQIRLFRERYCRVERVLGIAG